VSPVAAVRFVGALGAVVSNCELPVEGSLCPAASLLFESRNGGAGCLAMILLLLRRGWRAGTQLRTFR
jgi:hypothetical protein